MKYFALELCAGSIDQYFLESNEDVTGLVLPSVDQVLTSLIKGMAYIHSEGLVYGKIKPQNVLISARTQPAILQWADFGLVDPELEMISHSAETYHWVAPELIFKIGPKIADRNPNVYRPVPFSKVITKEEDVWSLGAVLYFFLSNGTLQPLPSPLPPTKWKEREQLLENYKIQLREEKKGWPKNISTDRGNLFDTHPYVHTAVIHKMTY